jgi:hypothetical protein
MVRPACLALLVLGLSAQTPYPSGASIAQAIRASALDPEACYRVRDLAFSRGGIRFYLTDGFLIFGKPIAGHASTAVFTAEVEGGDAELLLLPPDSSERRSLASYTGEPNLNEHFSAAVMIFTDGAAAELRQSLKDASPEMGALLADAWSPVARNLAESFETRITLDFLSVSPAPGFFFAAIKGKRLGNFDVVYDPRGEEQVLIGQTTFRDDRTFFDTWTSFASKSRNAAAAVPDASITSYKIDAMLDADLRLRVVTRLKATPAAPTRAVPLDISPQMQITAARVNGSPAEVFQRKSLRSGLIHNTGNDTFLIVSSAVLPAGQEAEIEVQHEGNVVRSAGNNVYFVGSRASWYPGRGHQFATFDLTFHYPKELDLVSTGQIVEDRTEGERRITRRRTDRPVRLAGFNLGVYQRTKITRAGTVIEICANRRAERALQPPVPPLISQPPSPFPRRRSDLVALPSDIVQAPDPTARLEPFADDIGSALDFMSARFGPPPLRNLTVSPVPGAFGQGFPGMIYLSTLSYLGANDVSLRSLSERQQLFFREILHAHEIAHQWWGNLVVSGGYHDEWLMEALAQYSALLHVEKRKGARSAEQVLEQYRGDLLEKTARGDTIESTGPIVLGSRLNSSQTQAAWRIITYEKGSWIIHMLRRRMGDARFLAMLGALRKNFEGKRLTTEAFRLFAAGFLPPNSPDPKLEAFYEQWVYGTGIPSLKLNYSVKGVKLTGTVVQSDVGEDFSVRVPIEIQYGRGIAPTTHWVVTSNEPAPFSLTLRRAPLKVALDPAQTVLAVRK